MLRVFFLASFYHTGEQVEAVAYDTPIPGYGTKNTNNLRLWSAKPSSEFNLESFNTGDYVAAILNKQRAETISSVLYPNDRTYQVNKYSDFKRYNVTCAYTLFNDSFFFGRGGGMMMMLITGKGASFEAATFFRVGISARYCSTIQGVWARVFRVSSAHFDTAQRHAPCDCHSRADAHFDGP